MSTTILHAHNIHVSYEQHAAEPLIVLQGLELTVAEGESVAITGASGSGKSTLLHVLAGLDKPSLGEVTICGHSMTTALNDKQRTALRNRYLGFVYQFHHLLPEFSARENVAMPLLIQGEKKETALARADYLLVRGGR